MMGRGKSEQGQFFYDLNLDDVVPPDHLVRKIDACPSGPHFDSLCPYYPAISSFAWLPTVDFDPEHTTASTGI
jgi:hypothetical protein